MTVAELIEHLSRMSPELPVYHMDDEGDWVPLKTTDVLYKQFKLFGTNSITGENFYVLHEDAHNPYNGVAVS